MTTRSGTYPSDADGDALRRVAADGSDMSRPMQVDFMIEVSNEKRGRAVARAAQGIGYRTRVEFDDGGDEDRRSWTVYCTRTMVLTYDAVIAAQEELNRISSAFEGYCDGWGTFGNEK